MFLNKIIFHHCLVVYCKIKYGYTNNMLRSHPWFARYIVKCIKYIYIHCMCLLVCNVLKYHIFYASSPKLVVLGSSKSQMLSSFWHCRLFSGQNSDKKRCSLVQHLLLVCFVFLISVSFLFFLLLCFFLPFRAPLVHFNMT